MAKKQIIWSSDYYMNDEAREEYENSQREILDDEDYTVSDRHWADVVDGYLGDERMNLDKQVDGIIIAFADLGLWNGRRQGYKILGSIINSIFSVSEDDNEWYGDGYNIRGRLTHHDGTHHVLYRVAKDRDEAERIATTVRLTRQASENAHAPFTLTSLTYTGGKTDGSTINLKRLYEEIQLYQENSGQGDKLAHK